MELEGVRPNPNLPNGDLYFASDAIISYEGANGLHHLIYPSTLSQNTELDEIRRGPSKSESVDGDIYLALDAKISYVWLNRPQHLNLCPRLYM